MNKQSGDIEESISDGLALLYFHSFSKKENLDWLAKIFPQQSEDTIYRESLAFEQFIIMVAISSYYKDDPIGPKISERFSGLVETSILEAKLFDNREEYLIFIRERMGKYFEAASTNREPNYIYWIGKTLNQYLGSIDVVSIMSISQYFVSMFKSYMDALKKMQKL